MVARACHRGGAALPALRSCSECCGMIVGDRDKKLPKDHQYDGNGCMMVLVVWWWWLHHDTDDMMMIWFKVMWCDMIRSDKTWYDQHLEHGNRYNTHLPPYLQSYKSPLKVPLKVTSMVMRRDWSSSLTWAACLQPFWTSVLLRLHWDLQSPASAN